MYNKKFTLGNSECSIADNNIKQKVIDFLYLKLDLSKFRYIILNNVQKLKFLQENEHYVSPNFKGYNYLLLMLTIDNKEYCVAIDRRKLSYHKNQLDMKTFNVIQLNVTTSESIYRGTIFDGKLIQTNNEFIFLIQDCFYLMGNNLDLEMDNKMVHIDNVLKNHFKKPYCLNFEFKLNKMYKYDELESMIENLPKSPIGTNGIIFYPKKSGINILHIEKKTEKVEINNNNIIEQKSYDIINNFVDFLKSRTYSYEQNGKTTSMWLHRTLIPDVYDIGENENDEKIGIALIPNLKISQLCDTIIQDKPVKFNCIYSNKFKKWIPLNKI
jgi:hypothetical protein